MGFLIKEITFSYQLRNTGEDFIGNSSPSFLMIILNCSPLNKFYVIGYPNQTGLIKMKLIISHPRKVQK